MLYEKGNPYPMKTEIGVDLFEKFLAECQRENGIPKRKHAAKNPMVIATIIEKAQIEGKTCKTLAGVVLSILELRGSPAQSKVVADA